MEPEGKREEGGKGRQAPLLPMPSVAFAQACRRGRTANGVIAGHSIAPAPPAARRGAPSTSKQCRRAGCEAHSSLGCTTTPRHLARVGWDRWGQRTLLLDARQQVQLACRPLPWLWLACWDNSRRSVINAALWQPARQAAAAAATAALLRRCPDMMTSPPACPPRPGMRSGHGAAAARLGRGGRRGARVPRGAGPLLRHGGEGRPA